MEQKRTLWVIAASGVFLLVVVGAALILYSPSVHRAQAAQAAFSPNDGWTAPIASATQTPTQSYTANPPVNPFEVVSSSTEAAANTSAPVVDANAQAAAPNALVATSSNGVQNTGAMVTSSQNQAPQTLQTSNVTVIADNTTVVGTGTTTIDLNALKASTPSVSSNVTAQNAATQAQIAATQAQIAQTQSAYEQRTATSTQAVATAPNYVYEPQQQKAAPTPAPAKTASTPKTSTATPKAVASTKTAAKPATTKTTASTASTKVADKFWVQAASYSTKKGADIARETLESNKIPSEIFTYTDANGTVFYRVRVGPYTTSTEAEYWKTQVAKIDKFAAADSYIVNSSAKAVK